MSFCRKPGDPETMKKFVKQLKINKLLFDKTGKNKN